VPEKLIYYRAVVVALK